MALLNLSFELAGVSTGLDPFALSDGFVDRVSHAARRYRDAEASKVLLTLVLKKVHKGIIRGELRVPCRAPRLPRRPGHRAASHDMEM